MKNKRLQRLLDLPRFAQILTKLKPVITRRAIIVVGAVSAIAVVSLGAYAATHQGKVALPGAISQVAKKIGIPVANTPAPGQTSPTPSSSTQPNDQASPSHSPSSASGTKNNGTTTTNGNQAAAPHLVVSVNPYVIFYSNQTPYLTISDGRQLAQPPAIDTAKFYIEWYNLGQGWRPLALAKNESVDSEETVTIHAKDLSGNSYSTTWKVYKFASRNLGLSSGSITKQETGGNLVFTGNVLFNPSSNIGNPSIRLVARGAKDFVNMNLCDVSHTDTTFTYTGQSSYSWSCTVSASQYSQYSNGFKITVDAYATWPLMGTIIYSTDFQIP